MRTAGVVDYRPAAGRLVDIKASDGALPLEAWVEARNIMYGDAGTPRKRDGFVSHHPRVDVAGGILATEPDLPTELPCLGLYEFDRYRNTHREPKRFFMGKWGQYLIGSRFGDEWNVPLAKGLGANSIPSFATFYREADRRSYAIVLTDDDDFLPMYWSGAHSAWGTGAGNTPKWGYLQRIDQLPDGKLAVVHNGRLFVLSQDGTTIYYSAGGDFLDFGNGGQFAVPAEFGQATAMFSTWYGELLIGQTRAIERTIFDGNGDVLGMVPITTAFGVMGPRCTSEVGSDQVFLATDARLRTISTTDRFGDLIAGELSQEISERLLRIPEGAWRSAFLENDRRNQILWIGHSLGSGTKNDTLTGWDYRHQKWLYAENRSIGGPSCAASLRTARWNRPTVHFGSYSLTTQSSGTHGTAGRVWNMNPLLKEDVFFVSRTESVESTATLHLKPRVNIPRSGGLNVTIAQVNATGTYQNASAYGAVVFLRATSSGTIGVSASVTFELEDRTAGQRGALTTNFGAAYTPGTVVDLATATYDSGFNFSLPSVFVTKGEEIQISTHSGRKIAQVMSSDLRDIPNGYRFCEKSEGFSYNFVPVLETPGIYYGDPQQTMHVRALTIVTKVTGNRADDQANDPDDHAGQNQYRHSLDLYVKELEDAEWSQVRILDGNSAAKPHLDVSLSEQASKWPERRDLKHALSSDGTEAAGTPMARDRDVNVEFVEVDFYARMFALRFGQETAASLDHTDAGGENTTEGMRAGDFELVAVHVHLDPAKHEAHSARASTSEKFDLPGVRR